MARQNVCNDTQESKASYQTLVCKIPRIKERLLNAPLTCGSHNVTSLGASQRQASDPQSGAVLLTTGLFTF